MKKLVRSALFALLAVGFNAAAFAAERGNLDDAIAMVKKAKAYIKANGNEKAYTEISNPKGQFVDRDIYIYVYDKNLKNLAHGGNQRLIGKDLGEMKDVDGKYFNRGLLEAAQKGGGTYTFKFLNPATKDIEQKTGYAEMAGDVMVGSGAYTK
jgi:cytochrome c